MKSALTYWKFPRETAKLVKEPRVVWLPISSPVQTQDIPRLEFFFDGGRWHPLSATQNSVDGEVSRSKAIEYMQQLKAQASQAKVRSFIESVSQATRDIKGLLTQAPPDDAKQKLLALLGNDELDHSIIEAIIRDLFEALPKIGWTLSIKLADLNLLAPSDHHFLHQSPSSSYWSLHEELRSTIEHLNSETFLEMLKGAMKPVVKDSELEFLFQSLTIRNPPERKLFLQELLKSNKSEMNINPKNLSVGSRCWNALRSLAK
jgi:hypothetical protein